MRAHRLIVALLSAFLAGCGVLGTDGPVPRVADVPRERTVDPQAAVALINAHRAARGRAPLVVDARLNAVAAQTARTLAERDTLKTRMHTAAGLGRRLDAAGIEASRAAENLGAGHPTLVQAVDGWKGSRRHNRALLDPELTHAGIGLAVVDRGTYRSFWVLVLATPDPEV